MADQPTTPLTSPPPEIAHWFPLGRLFNPAISGGPRLTSPPWWSAIQASPKRLQCCVAGGPFGSGNVLVVSNRYLQTSSGPPFSGVEMLVSGRVREWCKNYPRSLHVYRNIYRAISPCSCSYIFHRSCWFIHPYIRRIWDGFFMLDVCAFGIADVVDMIRIPAQLSWR